MLNKYHKAKRLAQRAHFRARAKERLGYELREEEITELIRQVQAGEADLITRPSARLVLWRVIINSRPMVVVYDLETDELVTMMGETIWQNQEMHKSPYVRDEGALRSTLAETQAGRVLAALLEKKNGV